MQQYLITVGLLVTALVFYVVGLSMTSVVFAALGLLSESAFWIRVVLKRGARTDLR